MAADDAPAGAVDGVADDAADGADADGARPSASARGARRRGGGGAAFRRGWVLALGGDARLWAAALPPADVQPLDAALAVFELGVRPGDVCIESGRPARWRGALPASHRRPATRSSSTRPRDRRAPVKAIARASAPTARSSSTATCAPRALAPRSRAARRRAAAAADGDGAAGGAHSRRRRRRGGRQRRHRRRRRRRRRWRRRRDISRPARAVARGAAAARALKRSRGRLCSYSRIEQTMRTCDALRAAGSLGPHARGAALRGGREAARDARAARARGRKPAHAPTARARRRRRHGQRRRAQARACRRGARAAQF